MCKQFPFGARCFFSLLNKTKTSLFSNFKKTQHPFSHRRHTRLPKKLCRIPRFTVCIEHQRICFGEKPGMEKKGWMYLHQHDSPPTVCGSNKKLGGVLQRHECWISGSTITVLGVSKKNKTSKSSFLIRFSIISHPFWSTPIFGNTHMKI